MQNNRKIVVGAKRSKRPHKVVSGSRNPGSKILISRQNRESIDRFIQKMGGTVETTRSNFLPLDFRSLLQLGLADPIFGYLSNICAIPVKTYVYPNGIVADFHAHFKRSLTRKPKFSPDLEYQLFLISKLNPQPLSSDEASEAVRFMCGSPQGRKTSVDTLRQIELRKQGKSIPQIAGIFAEERRRKHVDELIRRGVPATDAEKTARREYGREWQILEQKKIQKNLANQRKAARRKSGPKNYFGDPQNFMLVLRAGNTFLKVESAGS